MSLFVSQSMEIIASVVKSFNSCSCDSATLLSVLSSAYPWGLVLTIKENMSLIKILNKTGPKIDPWGTPANNVSNLLYVPFIFTHCLLPFRYENSNLHYRLSKPYASSLAISKS